MRGETAPFPHTLLYRLEYILQVHGRVIQKYTKNGRRIGVFWSAT